MSTILCLHYNGGIKTIDFDKVQHFDVFEKQNGTLALRIFPLSSKESLQFSLDDVILLPQHQLAVAGIHLTLKQIAAKLKSINDSVVIPSWMV